MDRRQQSVVVGVCSRLPTSFFGHGINNRLTAFGFKAGLGGLLFAQNIGVEGSDDGLPLCLRLGVACDGLVVPLHAVSIANPCRSLRKGIVV